MGLVVSFAGQIGSGKSSVSCALAKILGWPRVGFGDYLRAEASRRGSNPDSRQVLQDLGQSLVDACPETFCRAVLDMADFNPGGDLLLDGIRHVDIQIVVGRLVAPSKTKLLYLSAEDSTRLKRVADQLDCKSEFTRADQHQVEAELKDNLPTIADAVIDTQTDTDAVVRKCLGLIRSWCR